MNSLLVSTPAAAPAPHRRAHGRRGVLFHPKSSAGHVMADWCTRFTHQGRRVVVALGLGLRKAQELDLAVRDKLRAGETLDAVRAYVAQQLGRPPPKGVKPAVPTLRDVLQIHAATYFEALPSTTHEYRFCLLRMVETVLRDRVGLPRISRYGRRVQLEDYEAILNEPVTVLDDILVADYAACCLREVPRQTPQEMSAQASVRSAIHQAQAVFGADAMVAYRRAGLVLPDLTSFKGAPGFKRRKRTKLPPDAPVILRIHQDLRTLAHDGLDEALFTVIALALYAGLRRQEIEHAHTSWLHSANGPAIAVRYSAEWLPKDRDERLIPIPAWLYQRLQRLPEGYFLGQSKRERRLVTRRVLEWLRARGLADAERPLHEVRAIYAGFLISRYNIFGVKSRMGHGDIYTTLSHYAENPMADSLAALWDEVLPVQPDAAPVPNQKKSNQHAA